MQTSVIADTSDLLYKTLYPLRCPPPLHLGAYLANAFGNLQQSKKGGGCAEGWEGAGDDEESSIGKLTQIYETFAAYGKAEPKQHDIGPCFFGCTVPTYISL